MEGESRHWTDINSAKELYRLVNTKAEFKKLSAGLQRAEISQTEDGTSEVVQQ